MKLKVEKIMPKTKSDDHKKRKQKREKRTRVNGKRSWMALPWQTTKSDFKTVSFPRLIVGDDDDFGEVKWVIVLAGRWKVRDLFDASEWKCEDERHW